MESPPQVSPKVFNTEFVVRVSDINYGGHLGNDRVLSFFHETRVRWLTQFSWSEADIAGVGIVQTEAHLRYRAQSFLGDLLSCRLNVAEIKSRGFTLSYTLKREKKSAIIADGTTTLRFFDYKTQVIARTPERFFEVMAE